MMASGMLGCFESAKGKEETQGKEKRHTSA